MTSRVQVPTHTEVLGPKCYKPIRFFGPSTIIFGYVDPSDLAIMANPLAKCFVLSISVPGLVAAALVLLRGPGY